ncbi:interactor of constitutive active ROPs 3-like [Lotus japonicus]|uniref:interactor of constitutive active ROPs 3-like n=1 Tax=Lotus japonicus TaxID=34305 RepID=UPI00258FA28A|nr:interactor of constitutive active ROPs 3-like [Lotus japonicus]
MNHLHYLVGSHSVVGNMEFQLKDSTCSEPSQGQTLVNETLEQLDNAKIIVESIRDNVAKFVHDHNSTALDAAFCFFRYEVARLRSVIESAETKFLEERIRNMVKIKNVYESMELMKSESRQREFELQAELKTKEADIEELKANLMDKEIKLQGIVKENEKLNLNMMLGKSLISRKREYDLGKEFRRLDECAEKLNGDHMDKQATLQSLYEENIMLKFQIGKATMKLEIVTEEAVRLAEQMEVLQEEMFETKEELRRVKVQSDQWRKAVEAAASMISAENNEKLTERSLSLDNKCNPPRNRPSNFAEENNDDFQRKKDGNMLKKIKGLWKKYIK